MSSSYKIQNSIGENKKIENNQIKHSIPLSVTQSGRHYFYITNKTEGDQTSIEVIKAKKASFKSLPLNIFNSLQGKVIKIRGHHINDGKKQKYYVQMDQICKLCDLPAEKVKELQKQGKLEKLMQIWLSMHDALETSELDPIYRLQNRHWDKTTSILDSDNISCEDFTQQIINHTILSGIQETSGLRKEEFSKLELLSKYVPAENINKLLEDANNIFERIKLLNTFYQASSELTNGLPTKTKYVKGSKVENGNQSFNFTLSQSGEFIIALPGELSSGSFSKIKRTYNVSNLEKSMVQRVVRGKNNLDDLAEAEPLLQELYEEKCPYILPPSEIKIEIVGKLKDKAGKTLKDENGNPKLGPKLVSIEPAMECSGDKIGHEEFPLKLQTMHDMAKGLAFIHSKNKVHGDVKPANCLIKNGRALVSDLTSIKNEGDETLLGATKLYAAPERDHPSYKCTTEGIFACWNAKYACDNYSLGVSILDLVFAGVKSEKRKDKDKIAEIYCTIEKLKKDKTVDDKLKEYFHELRKSVKANDIYINEKLAAITIAEKLMAYQPKARITSRQAANLLGTIPGVITTDPVF